MSEAGDAAARDDGDVIPPRAQPTYQITPPGPFSFANPAEWPRWYRRFDRFRRASGLATQPSGEQVNALIYGTLWVTKLRTLSTLSTSRKSSPEITTSLSRGWRIISLCGDTLC